MKLSIITVNYNNPLGLEETLKSIASQTRKDFEYVVVDGASTQGDLDIIKKYEDYIDKWVSEPDAGIYNAMNKAVKIASGEYCLFMNSGDTLYRNTTVEEIYKEPMTADFIEGIITFKNRPGVFHYPVKEINLSYYMFVTNNYHQASLIRRSMLLEHPYDESYRISSDMKFNMDCMINHNCTYSPMNVVISTYEGGGVSDTVMNLDEVDRKYKELFQERILNDYEEFRIFYEWPLNRLYPFLKRIGHSVRIYKLYLRLKGKNQNNMSKSERLKLWRMENWNKKSNKH